MGVHYLISSNEWALVGTNPHDLLRGCPHITEIDPLPYYDTLCGVLTTDEVFEIRTPGTIGEDVEYELNLRKPSPEGIEAFEGIFTWLVENTPFDWAFGTDSGFSFVYRPTELFPNPPELMPDPETVLRRIRGTFGPLNKVVLRALVLAAHNRALIAKGHKPITDDELNFDIDAYEYPLVNRSSTPMSLKSEACPHATSSNQTPVPATLAHRVRCAP